MREKIYCIVAFLIGGFCILALLMLAHVLNLSLPDYLQLPFSDDEMVQNEIRVVGEPDSIMDLNIILGIDPDIEPINAFQDISDYLDNQLILAQNQRENLPPATREDLFELLEIPETCLNNQTTNLISDEVLSDTAVNFVVHRLTISVCEDDLIMSGLYVPNEGAPLIIAIHGTAGSPERILGIDGIDDYHHEFAKQLVEAGYSVFAPYIVTQAIDSEFINRDRDALDRRARVLGTSLLGIEIGQLMLIDNYFTDTHTQFGVYGISLGGQLAYYLGAAEPNMDVTIVSSWAEDRDEKLAGDDVSLYPLWMIYKSGQYNLLDDYLLLFDDIRLAGLVHPRALFFDSGETDARSQSIPNLVEEIELQYYLDSKENVEYHIGQGGHEIFFPNALEFLQQILTR